MAMKARVFQKWGCAWRPEPWPNSMNTETATKVLKTNWTYPWSAFSDFKKLQPLPENSCNTYHVEREWRSLIPNKEKQNKGVLSQTPALSSSIKPHQEYIVLFSSIWSQTDQTFVNNNLITHMQNFLEEKRNKCWKKCMC